MKFSESSMPAIDQEELLQRIANYFNEKVSCNTCETPSWIVDKLHFSYQEGAPIKVEVKALCRKCNKTVFLKLSHKALRDYIFPT